MTVELFTQAYNEEDLLPYFIDHYRDLIPGIIINVYNNHSTDNTGEVAREYGCNVYTIDTGNEIRDDKLLEFKNQIWKNSQADWVIVCDVDEFLNISQEDLELIHDCQLTTVKCEAYDMVSETFNPDTVTEGIRNPMYDKVLLFKRTAIRDINYTPGAHTCSPSGNDILVPVRFQMYHMRYLGLDKYIKRYADYAKRLSELNKEKGWGSNYLVHEDRLISTFQMLNETKIKVR